jgi:hypothetical protein
MFLTLLAETKSRLCRPSKLFQQPADDRGVWQKDHFFVVSTTFRRLFLNAVEALCDKANQEF